MDKLKQRTGRECKKTNCKRHKSYIRWLPGNNDHRFCMQCKNAHVSQYKKETV